MTSRPTRVVVTGGARGIGRAVARRFAADGAQVVVVDRDGDAAERTAEEIPLVTGCELDVCRPDDVERLFADAEAPFDVVVANAGIPGRSAPIVDIDTGDWCDVMEVNLNGVFHTIRAAARRMMREGMTGSIIVTASIAGLTGEENAAPYAASKWAVIGLLKSAALELAPHGIRVNGVCPGDVDTGLLSQLVDEGAFHGPYGRPAQPDEIAGAYVWLASSAAAYISGETITVDGGLVNTALVH